MQCLLNLHELNNSALDQLVSHTFLMRFLMVGSKLFQSIILIYWYDMNET